MALVWNSILDFGSICSSLISGVCHFIGCQLDMLYLGWLTSVLYPAILTIFILPFFILLFLYFSSLVLYIYTRRWRQVREVLQGGLHDPWAGGRYLISLLWDAHGYIWHGYDVQGAEHIPADKGALIVYYHGAIPVDVYYLVARFITSTGRHIHCVGDRFLQKIPGWNSILEAFSVSPSSVSECVKTVRAGHLLAISPGGVREAQFSDHSYSLLWGSRKGFAKVAIQANCPIIPMFTRNVREAFRVVTFPSALYSALYTRFKLPFAPIYGGFPVKLVSYLGPCVYPLPNESEEHLARRVERAVYCLVSEHQRLPGNIMAALLDRLHPKLAHVILGPSTGCLPDYNEASSDEEQTFHSDIAEQESSGETVRRKSPTFRSASVDDVPSQSLEAECSSQITGDGSPEAHPSSSFEDQGLCASREERVASSPAVLETIEGEDGLYATKKSYEQTRDITATSDVALGEFEASAVKEVLSSITVRKRKKRRSHARSTAHEKIDLEENLILPSSLMKNILEQNVRPNVSETPKQEINDVQAEEGAMCYESEIKSLEMEKESVGVSECPASVRESSGLITKDLSDNSEQLVKINEDFLDDVKITRSSPTVEADPKREISSKNMEDEVVSDSYEPSSSLCLEEASKVDVPGLYSKISEASSASESPKSESFIQESLTTPTLSSEIVQSSVRETQESSSADHEQEIPTISESHDSDVLESREDHFSLRPEDMGKGEPSSTASEIREDLSFSENGKASLAAEVHSSGRAAEKGTSHTSSDSESSSGSSFEMVDAKKAKS